jgi:hypothetical protein
VAGDYGECRRLLDRARALRAAAGRGGGDRADTATPVLGSSTVPNLAEVTAASCPRRRNPAVREIYPQLTATLHRTGE